MLNRAGMIASTYRRPSKATPTTHPHAHGERQTSSSPNKSTRKPMICNSAGMVLPTDRRPQGRMLLHTNGEAHKLLPRRNQIHTRGSLWRTCSCQSIGGRTQRMSGPSCTSHSAHRQTPHRIGFHQPRQLRISNIHLVLPLYDNKD